MPSQGLVRAPALLDHGFYPESIETLELFKRFKKRKQSQIR